MPYVFDGKNDYGSSIFVRYKHRVDATEEKVGLKVGHNKNLLVKDYQDLMLSKSFSITNFETVNEITTFVKQTTSSGNVKYAADIGHDDCVMTIVNATSIFVKNEFKEMVEDYMEKDISVDMKNYINDCLKKSDYFEAVDYTQLLDVRRKHLNSVRTRNSGYKSTGFGNNESSSGVGGDWFKL